jgi:HAE1 family hydrophobic/amphiphilic exporter-1
LAASARSSPCVTQITSTSSLGSTAIVIQFSLDRDIDGAANDVQAAINAAAGQLPKNLASPPTYRKVNPADSPILLLGATSDTLPLTEVDDSVETRLAPQISQISGVAQVLIAGQQKPAIRIQLDPAKLVAKGLSLEDVRASLSIATVDNPKGPISSGAHSFTIYTNDQLTRSKDWNDIVVAHRNGGALRVRDIGRAVTGPLDTTQAAWADGKRGVFLVIFKQPGANVIETVGRIMDELPRLTATIPPAIKVFTLSDRAQTIRASVRDVQFSLLLTIAFLRSLWATLIPSVAVPLSLLGAVALMWAAGYSLDNLSLMAVKNALGLPLTISTGFQGNGLAPDPRLPGGRLPHTRHSVRELYSSDHYPLNAAIRGGRHLGHADRIRPRCQPHRAGRHHPAHRHRQKEWHHARRLHHRRRA